MAYEMVMPYHLHMPSYFLETFTEYPYLIMILIRLAHLLWEQGVVGSNPATPTDESQGVTVKCSSFFLFSEWGGLPLV